MKAICLECNNVIEFKQQRGNKLKYHRCSCGGGFRPLTRDHELEKWMNCERVIYMVKLRAATPRFEWIGNEFIPYIPPERRSINGVSITPYVSPVSNLR